MQLRLAFMFRFGNVWTFTRLQSGQICLGFTMEKTVEESVARHLRRVGRFCGRDNCEMMGWIVKS